MGRFLNTLMATAVAIAFLTGWVVVSAWGMTGYSALAAGALLGITIIGIGVSIAEKVNQ